MECAREVRGGSRRGVTGNCERAEGMKNIRAEATQEQTAKPQLQGSTLERLRYLSPKRYFRFYMLYLPDSRKSCWLPEGFLS